MDYQISDMKYNFTLFQTIFMGITTISTLALVIYAAKQIKHIKSSYLFPKFVDVIMMYNERYDQIMSLKINSSIDDEGHNKEKIKGFFKKYWSLHAEEFDSFLMGIIDPITYARWLRKKVHVFKDQKFMGNCSGWSGWKKYGQEEYINDPLFTHLIESIFSYAYQNTEDQNVIVKVTNFIRQKIKTLYEDDIAKIYRNVVTRNDKEKWDWGKLEELDKLTPPRASAGGDFKKFHDAEKFSLSISHEKINILLPSIQKEFKEFKERHNIGNNNNIIKVIDFGCGDFTIGRNLEKSEKNIHIYGYDPDIEMLRVAHSNDDNDKPSKLFSRLDDFNDSSFNYCLMVFVHQTQDSQISMTDLFKKAYQKLKPRGEMLIIGAHPDHIGKKFAAFQFDRMTENLNPGDKYGGKIFGSNENDVYIFDGKNVYDVYWPLKIVKDCLKNAGFQIVSSKEEYIKDVNPSCVGEKVESDGHPYFKIIAQKS